jgi:gliding motility-associatede transport system auxiliary component
MSPQRATRIFGAAGVVAAGVVALLVNVLAARHYRRWDLTGHGLYTLSAPTLSTLRSLGEPIELDVLLASKDPLNGSVKSMLEAYQAQTDKLVVRYVDPDWHPAEFLALQQKYGLEAGRTEDGRVVTDAAIVVSRSGKRPFFVAGADLVDVSGDELRARSKLEQALTLTLRRAIDDERPKICFVVGHGERRLDDRSSRGLGELDRALEKNNYDPVEVDTSLPNATEPLSGCEAAVIAGPTEPFAAEDAARIRGWFEGGGNLFVLASPVPDSRNRRIAPSSLGSITGAAGIAFGDDFIFELDPSRKLPGGFGDQFLAEPKTHAVTSGLVGERNRDLKILMVAAQSVSRLPGGSTIPAEILVTSKDAFGMTDFFGWVQKGGAPERAPGDHPGPLAVAMANELPAKGDRAAQAHGPRMVVVGSASVALGQNWQEPVLRGGAIFTESAISWLAAKPAVVDIPDKPAFAGARIDEAALGDVFRYVVLYMPVAVLLLGLSVFLRRRSTERVASPGPRTGKE